MTNNTLYYTPATELAAMIRQRAISPVELTELLLERIAQLNPKLNAFCTEMTAEARLMAQQSELAIQRGETLGPLHGVPISIKDNIYVKGSRTTFGSQLLKNFVPTEDAPVVARLRKAGAIFIGRTNTPEFGWKGVTDNSLFGATKNAWNLHLTPGGSSGGASAAVASGLAPVGIGTDGGGSLRIPASFSGLVGHKPSYGRVPHYPGISVGALRHIGAITRTVSDSALLLDIIAGHDTRDSTSLPDNNLQFLDSLERSTNQLRIAYSHDLGYAQVDPEVAQIVQQAAFRFTEVGASVEQIDLDWSDPYPCWKVLFFASATARLGAELAQHGHLLDPGLRAAVEQGLQLKGTDITNALAGQQQFLLQVLELFKQFDLLLMPTLAVKPFPLNQNNAPDLSDQKLGDLQWTQFTYPFNLTGQPAVNVPAGWAAGKLPVGMQIVGRPLDDETVLNAARAWELIQPWTDNIPPIA